MSNRDENETARLYGPWQSRRPEDAAALLAGYDGLWWIAGGHAIEAFTGVTRGHSDLDISVPRSEVPLLRAHLAGSIDVWAADDGTLRPLVGAPNEPLPETCGNLWLRRSGADPWEYDVIVMSATRSTWRYKRNERISRPTGEILWSLDGITYLRPEVQLLHNAPGLRLKDQHDFDACAPLLDDGSRRWLRSALELAHPGHPWLTQLPW